MNSKLGGLALFSLHALLLLALRAAKSVPIYSRHLGKDKALAGGFLKVRKRFDNVGGTTYTRFSGSDLFIKGKPMSDGLDALSLIEDVLETRGYLVEGIDEREKYIDFGLPNNLSGDCKATIEIIVTLGIIQLTVDLIAGRVNHFLRDGLYQLCHSIQDIVPGIALTYIPDLEDGDSLELSLSHFLCKGETPDQLSAAVDRLSLYGENCLHSIMPVLMYFIGQKPIVSIDAYGTIISVRPRVTIEECLGLIRTEPYGRA